MSEEQTELEREPMPKSLKEWRPAILFFGFIVLIVITIAVAAAVIDISIYGF